jgi:leader peptidase (prepilin peptidase) / N-methyltransferase
MGASKCTGQKGLAGYPKNTHLWSGAVWFALIYWIVIGAAVGSFVNVVAYRLPQGLSLVWPPSACPQCKTPLGATENIPIFGWAILGGKCKHCQTSISWRYPAVEFAGAVLFGVLALYFQASFTPASLVEMSAWGFFIAVLLALSLIDIDIMELPSELTRAGILVGLLFRTFYPIWVTGLGNAGPPGLVDSLYGLLLGIGLFDTISFVGEKIMGKEAMGGGDAILAAMMGVWLGWKLLLVSLALGFTLGAVIGVVAIATGLLKREEPFPFGPFLALGGVGGLLFGEILIASYLNFI